MMNAFVIFIFLFASLNFFFFHALFLYICVHVLDENVRLLFFHALSIATIPNDLIAVIGGACR
jgi:hypothetical protein